MNVTLAELTAPQFSHLVRYGLLALFGVYFTLIGFRVIRVSKRQGPDVDAWYDRWGNFFKAAGPIMIVVGVYFVIRTFI